MKFKNEEGWKEGIKNNQDGYGKAVYDYAEWWANKMEKLIEEGKLLEEIWEKSSFDEPFGITGFQYGCAVGILSELWIHGEQLKKLHNTHYGQPDTKGVVNPAILVLKEEDKK